MLPYTLFSSSILSLSTCPLKFLSSFRSLSLLKYFFYFYYRCINFFSFGERIREIVKLSKVFDAASVVSVKWNVTG